MENYTNRTWAEIDLDALENNIKNIKAYVSEKSRVLAVVKADAYGHGCVKCAKTLLENGADMLGVAFADEAKQIRDAGIDCPVLVLGYTMSEDIEKLVKLEVTPTIYSLSSATEFSNAAKKYDKKVKIHIKLDTGMNRIGFPCNEKSVEEVAEIVALENIEIEGIFTHFSCADESSREYTDRQAEKFTDFISKLEKKGIIIPIKHACNSAGIVMFPEYHFDMVRAGIILYGVKPSEYVDISSLKLKPVLTLKSRIVRVLEIAAGEKISYGGTFVSEKPIKIAALGVGYADGYIRAFSNKANMLIGQQTVKVVGRICMDQCIIDVTNVNNIKVEDEVVVAGGPSDSPTSFDRLAEIAGTINYELLCLIGKRVPRVYFKNGRNF